jgi:cyclopropane-fatty-acyl-phospholipid synthase
MSRGATAVARRRVEGLLGRAGIRTDGRHPWDLQVHREDFFPRVLAEGSLGFGDAYVEGWWDCAALDELLCRLWRARLPQHLTVWRDLPRILQAKFVNLQRGRRAFRVGRHHYDIGNDLYRAMLDPRMIYSCGYWARADDLAAAQEAKLGLVCRKLQLAPGMRVLDIGCGWGGAARYAAERCGVEVVGVTVSRAQADLAREACRGLPVDIRLVDYREVRGTFDRIFSIGMFEHVGHRNYRTYFDVVRRCLADGGLFLLQTIGSLRSTTRTDPWIARRIFPNSMLPSARHITAASEGRLVMEDWHNFGADYDRTLMAWQANIESAWERLPSEPYDAAFRRMWRYYLLGCAGGFRARELQLWQVVFSKDGCPGGYRAEGMR